MLLSLLHLPFLLSPIFVRFKCNHTPFVLPTVLIVSVEEGYVFIESLVIVIVIREPEQAKRGHMGRTYRGERV